MFKYDFQENDWKDCLVETGPDQTDYFLVCLE